MASIADALRYRYGQMRPDDAPIPQPPQPVHPALEPPIARPIAYFGYAPPSVSRPIGAPMPLTEADRLIGSSANMQRTQGSQVSALPYPRRPGDDLSPMAKAFLSDRGGFIGGGQKSKGLNPTNSVRALRPEAATTSVTYPLADAIRMRKAARPRQY